MTDQVRVLRIVEYVGNRDWIDHTVNKSIRGRKDCGPGCYIQATTLTAYPEALEKQPETEDCSYCMGEGIIVFRNAEDEVCEACKGTGKQFL